MYDIISLGNPIRNLLFLRPTLNDVISLSKPADIFLLFKSHPVRRNDRK